MCGNVGGGDRERSPSKVMLDIWISDGMCAIQRWETVTSIARLLFVLTVVEMKFIYDSMLSRTWSRDIRTRQFHAGSFG